MISFKVKTPIETGSGSEKENSSDLVRSEKKRRREEEGSKEEKRRKKDELENGKGGEDLKPKKEKSREEKDRDREREKRREKERKEKREKERREGGEKREKTAEKEKDGKKEDRPPKPKDPKDAVKQHLSFKVGSNLSATYFNLNIQVSDHSNFEKLISETDSLNGSIHPSDPLNNVKGNSTGSRSGQIYRSKSTQTYFPFQVVSFKPKKTPRGVIQPQRRECR